MPFVKNLSIFCNFSYFFTQFFKKKTKSFWHDNIFGTKLTRNLQGVFHQNFEKWKGIVWDSNSFISKTLLCSEPFPLHYTLCLCCAIQSKNSHHINMKGNAIIPMVIAKTAIITRSTIIRLSVIMRFSFYSFLQLFLFERLAAIIQAFISLLFSAISIRIRWIENSSHYFLWRQFENNYKSKT